MFGIRGKNSKESLVAVVDIGSAGAGVAYVSLSSSAKIVAAMRSTLQFEERSEDATISGIAEQISSAGKGATAQYAQTHKQPKVSKVYAILRAPWIHSRTTTASKKFDQDIRVTQSLIGQLAQEALGQVEGVDHNNILEASVVRVLLNGYPCGNPVGIHAREVTVSALMTVCEPKIRAAAQAAIESIFPASQIVWRSGVRALLGITGERAEHSNNYVIADVEGEGTDVVIVRKGIMEGHLLVPEGMRTMLSKISPTGLPEETLSTMRLVATDQCDGPTCDALNSSIARIEPELARTFGEAMGKQAAFRHFPNKLVLIAPQDVAGWLSRFFTRIDFTQFTQTAQPFTVETLSPEDISEWAQTAPGVKADIGLLVGAALVNIELG